jgi:hypothetical protein
MNTEQPRTDAISRERSPDHQYTLSIEQGTDLYDKAGLPRTPRAIQKYCALSKLDCRKVETETCPHCGSASVRFVRQDTSDMSEAEEADYSAGIWGFIQCSACGRGSGFGF